MSRWILLPLLVIAAPLHAQRARDLGIPFQGTPGPLNAITDVAGVEVGHATLIRGSGPLVVGQGPVRTGVTAVFPRGKASQDPVMAAWFTLNGNGEMTGTTWVEESGFLGGPVMITNTHSVGAVHDGVIAWVVEQGKTFDWSLPVVAETWDGGLNDINGLHVRREHVYEAIADAKGGAVTEGAVGGGTGMVCHGFKGGIGTASRRLRSGFTVGVLVQCNYGLRRQLRIGGALVGPALAEPRMCYEGSALPATGAERGLGLCDAPAGSGDGGLAAEQGSIIILVATDAPLLSHQLKRLVKRAALGVGRVGGTGGNGSGDIFLAFSTANPGADLGEGVATVQMLANPEMNGLFEATIDATEEAILNAMVAASTMVGANGLRVPRLPHDRVRALVTSRGG